MTLSEASQTFKIPLKALRDLQKDGYIKGEPFAKSDIHFLACIRAIWCKEKYIQHQLARISAKKRYALAIKAPMNRIERWIFERYFSLPKGKRLSIETVVHEVCSIFKTPDTHGLRKTIIRIRKRAYNLRSRMRMPFKQP
jgi:hypothetical protein